MNFLIRLFYTILYFRKPVWDTGISPPELMEFIQEHPPGRALDLGCGSGTNAITLAQNGWQVVGVDYVGRAIRKARDKARKAGLEIIFHVDDVTRLDKVYGSFDLILDIGCLHGLSSADKTAYAHNLERLLAPGGVFLLYAFFRTPDGDWFGLDESDLERLGERLEIIQREDGTERGRRPSAWLTYQKQR
jgi:SAM-dependent methyltransferase